MLVFAFFSTLGSAIFFYLSFPKQRWLSAPLSAHPARWVSLVLAALSLWAWSSFYTPKSAFFITLTLLMFFFMLLPFLGLWRQAGGSHDE